MKTTLLFGEVLVDQKTLNGIYKEPEPGGPPLYMANLLLNFPTQPIIVAHYGKDFPKDWIPPFTTLVPSKAMLEKNPRYFLEYHNGSRNMRINNPECFVPVVPTDLEQDVLLKFKTATLALFGSTLSVYTPKIIQAWKKHLPQAVFILLAQGLLRQNNPNGKIILRSKEKTLTCISKVSLFLDAIILSEEDHKNDVIEEICSRFSLNTVIIITRGIQGTTIVYQKKRITVPTKWPQYRNNNQPLDTTGAGDRWAGVFAHRYYIDKVSLKQAALEAHRVTAFCIGKSMKKSQHIPLKQLLSNAR